MNTGRTIFAQMMDYLPRHEFQKCVDRHHGNFRVRRFSCLDQFLCMAFAQLTYRESLRDIQACLGTFKIKLYHMGIRGKIFKTTLADANQNRDWHIYADFAQVLIGIAQPLYADDDFGVQLDQTAYALDSSTIDLCLSLFPWATFRTTKAGIKLHTLLNLRGNIPVFACITNASLHDVNLLDDLPLEPGSFYIMDRGYTDFGRLNRFTEQMAFYVIRAKSNFRFDRRYSRDVDKTTGLRFDQTVVLGDPNKFKDYPTPLRRIGFVDPLTAKRLVFLTNNFVLPPLTIAQLYKSRWQVELFFKWIKQHLRIKSFFGTSPNAVKTQIWIALSTYVLVAIVKKKLRLSLSLYTILQILSVSLFEKTPILEVFSDDSCISEMLESQNQLSLLRF
jgi:hypothetical protein